MIDSSTEYSTICPVWLSMAPSPSEIDNTAKPNSPPTASTSAVLQAVSGSTPDQRTTCATSRILLSSSTAVPVSTQSQMPGSAIGSISMPTPTKKSPSSTSRNGRMVASTWCLNSVSPSIMPARKAPKAIDRPSMLVAQPALNDTSSTVSVNSSAERCPATKWNSGRSSQRPPYSTTTKASTALASASAMSPSTVVNPAAAPNTGIRISKGTAVTSWNTDIATPRRPCRLFSSPCAISWLLMTVVDDCAKTAPITKALAAGRPSTNQASSPTTSVVNPTCAVPSVSTVLRNAWICGSE